MTSASEWEIEDVRRSYVVYREGDHVSLVPGEVLAGGYLRPDFVIYARNPIKWKSPYDNETISDHKKQEIINRVCEGLKARGLKTEVEY